MAESITYDPAETRNRHVRLDPEIDQLEARVKEVNALLDELYASGLVRWLKDLAGALPSVSNVALEQINTPEGHAGLRNLLALSQQLGRVDPDKLQSILQAMESATREVEGQQSTTNAYNPPGVFGTLRLLRDEELWAQITPLLTGIKAYSRVRSGEGSSAS